jgi:hypothetical protein
LPDIGLSKRPKCIAVVVYIINILLISLEKTIIYIDSYLLVAGEEAEFIPIFTKILQLDPTV